MTQRHQPDHAPPPSGPLAALPWAVFLACSWTWCIGLLLPAILVRDYGPWAFIVFAVPNVLGAAAFAWVIRRKSDSEHLLARHHRAIRAFALITAAFQAFFIGWLMTRLSVGWGPGIALALLAILAAASACIDNTRRAQVGAFGALIVSALAAAVWLATGEAGLPDPGTQGFPLDLVWLAPAVVFGFLLCPYLDPTFHRARQALDLPTARLAFGIGFGGIFLALILFSLAYSGWIAGAIRAGSADLTTPAIALLLVHLTVQAGFTMGLHLRERGLHLTTRELRTATARARITGRLGADLPWMLGLIVLLLLTAVLADVNLTLDMSLGEVTYRLFLAFYGLIFPTYVWLCVLPRRAKQPELTRESVRLCMATIGVASPMFFMGFIAREPIWLLPGVAILLLARLFVPGGPLARTKKSRKR